MNYQQIAEKHVRSVCPELKRQHETQPDFYSWDTPHLEHWLRGIESVVQSHGDIETADYYMGAQIEFILKNGKSIMFDLKTGQPATEEDYKAYCEICQI